MIKKYKKGDVLAVKYKLPYTKGITRSVGIILNISESEITLAHNFSGTSPIDVTKIIINDILEMEKMTPKEINSLSDLKIR